MALSPNRPTIKTNEEYLRRLGDVIAYFVPYNPVISTTRSVIKPVGTLCTITAMDNPTIAMLNEREAQTMGKKRIQVNDGYELSPFNLTIEGNTIKDVAALTGHNMNQTGFYSFQQIGEYGLMGALILKGYAKDSNIILRQDVYTNVNMKVTEMPGSGETYTITFYAKEPKIFTCIAPMVVAVDAWYDDGVVTNAAALTATQACGTGNDSLLVAPTDTTAADHYLNGTNAERYLFSLYRNGVEVPLADTVFTPGVAATSNGIITPPTTNPSGSYQVAIYPMWKGQAGFTDTAVPGVRSDLYTARAMDVNGGSYQDWNNYIGEL